MQTSFRYQAVIPVLVALSVVVLSTPTTSFGGELEKRVLEIYRLGDDLDPCEKKTEEKVRRLKIARALDARALEFKNYLRSTKFEFTGDETRVGPLSLATREVKTTTGEKNSKEGWVSFTMGWDDFEREYAEIANQRMNKRWVKLLGLVETTIEDDYQRGVKGEWMGASIEGITEAKKLSELIDACLTSEVCGGLENPEDFKNALFLTPNAASDYSDYLKTKESVDQEIALNRLSDEIQPFARFFEPVKQPGARFTDEKTLLLSLDSGQFRGFETDLTAVIARYWNVLGNTLSIEWMTSTRDEPLFKFLFSPVPKSPSYVDYARRVVTLGQASRDSVPAHLIGRMLGFRSRYFSIWRSEGCHYEDQRKPSDLISDGRNGSVLPEHWESLKTVYAQ